MYLFDGKVTLEDREYLESFFHGFDYRTSGLSYTSVFMWREINAISWKQIGDYLCMTAADNLDPALDDTFMFPPLTRTGGYDPESLRRTIFEAKDAFEEKGLPFTMKLIPFHMLEIFSEAIPGKLNFEADRANFDYVYDTKDLIELKGRDYHSKKNHLNFFLANYEYEYGKLSPDMTDEVMKFVHEFNERKNLEDPHERVLLNFEERAMHDVLLNLDTVGYLSGAIRIDGKIEAISIGGKIGTKTVVVHAEKANTDYRGLYQAINNEFCRAMASNVKRINREEDMGIPGLRKAKLSYKPVRLIEKYTITLK